MIRRSLEIRSVRITVSSCLAVVCLAYAFLAGPAAGKDPLEEGLRLYLDDVNLSDALTTFQAVVADEKASAADRARASQYVAMVLYVNSEPPHEEVRAAIRRMFELDPGITPDPESVQPSFMQLCYETSMDMDLFALATAAHRERVLAVFDFDNASFDDKEKWDAMEIGFAQMLITDLLRVRDLQIVERQKLQYVLGELDLHRGGRVDPQTATEAGKLLGAGTLVFGSFSAVGKDLRIDVRLVRTETGEVIKAGKITGRTKKFFELQEKLARLVVDEILPKSERAENLPKGFGSPRTKSLEAALAYSEGLRLQDAGMFDEAYEKYAEAISLSPDFQEPRTRMQYLQPHLKG